MRDLSIENIESLAKRIEKLEETIHGTDIDIRSLQLAILDAQNRLRALEG